MIICPWCGTSYAAFQPNCKNCGGPLQEPDEISEISNSAQILPAVPLAPRPISERYIWHLIYNDNGWWIVALVFGILGGVFTLIGAPLTIAVITAFVGIPFLFIGLAFLGGGIWLFLSRYQNAQQIVRVLREGQATRGHILEVDKDLTFAINGQNPWKIRYRFQANGQDYEGSLSTFNYPGKMQAGHDINVLYLPDDPKWNSVFPHP